MVIKAGSDGAYYFNQDTTLHIPTTPVNHVVDTTSASDSFNAGSIQGYLMNKPIQKCAEQGNCLAGMVIQHKGAIISKEATASLFTLFNCEE